MLCSIDVLDLGRIDLVDYMGSDISVVNAARVSFSNESEYDVRMVAAGDGDTDVQWEYFLSERDQKLIKYLAKHNHWTPFGHITLSFRFKAPLFVARQLAKHQVGLVWNEESRRYVDHKPEFYTPAVWRARAENAKQGSSPEAVNDAGWLEHRYHTFIDQVVRRYETYLDTGLAPELARMLLPQSMFTEWIWTGSLAAFARVYKLRIDSHAQWETQQYAKALGELIPSNFKHSWEALTGADIAD